MKSSASRLGNSQRWFIITWFSILFAAQAFAASSGPLGTDITTDSVVVVLDRLQNAQDIVQRLAAAGFPTVEIIRGLPLKYANWRRVPANNDAATRAALLGVDGVTAVRPVFHADGVNYPILTNGQIIVKFQPATTVAQVNNIASQNGCIVIRQIAGLPQSYVLEPIQPDAQTQDVTAAIKASGLVKYAHPSILLHHDKYQLTIDDPLYAFQWHLKNTGQLAGSKVGADINVEEAWETTLGSGAIVADIDDCVQKDHEDLRDNFLTGTDFVTYPTASTGDPSPTYGPDPYFGDSVGEAHGTSTAGLICGAANSLGGRGVAPAASLIGVKLGFGNEFSTDQDFADAFLFAESNGAMAINNSWGTSSTIRIPTIPDSSYLLPDLVSDAIDEISTNGRGGKGVLVIFAAGNGDPFAFAPSPLPVGFGNIYGTLPRVMTVGATMRDDTVACYSNFGSELSVMAPGGGTLSSFLSTSLGCFESDITTTDVSEVPCLVPYDFDFDGQFPDPGFPCRGYNPPMRFLDVFLSCDLTAPVTDCFILAINPAVSDFPASQYNYTHHFNGTSAATPVVTGIAALVFSINSDLTAEQVKNLIEHTADKVASINELFDVVTGQNNRYAHGRVNAGKAVKAAVAGKNWPSPVTDVQQISSQGLIRIQWTNPTADASGVLIVRAAGSTLNWAPVDTIDYSVGQIVAPGVTVVSNDLRTLLDETGLPSGDFQYALFVRNAGNYYSWGRRTGFTANNPTASPKASIGASPTAGSLPLSVHFAGGAIDQNPIVAYNWDFGDGSTGVGATIDHTYTKGGTFIARLTVTSSVNATGSTTQTIQVAGTPNSIPQAAVTANPSTGDAPLAVSFLATATDSDGFIVSYSWDFGDGSTGSGQNVQHVYLVAGTYAAILTVTDNQGGINYASQTILVTGSGATAAATDPPGILTRKPSCGFGIPGATVMSLLGLSLMAAARRRF